MLQRRASMLKLLVRKGAMSPEDLDKLLNNKVAMCVEVVDQNAPLNDTIAIVGANNNINVLLHQEDDVVQTNAREAVGIDRNLSGEHVGKTHIAAEETGNVARGGALRLGRKQRSVRRAYKQLCHILAGLVATHWQAPQAVRVVGQDGAESWEEFRAEFLRSGRYTFRVRFTVEHYASQEQRQDEGMALMERLWNVPGIDKAALTQMTIAMFGRPGVRAQKGGGAGALPVSMPGLPGGGGSATPGGPKG
jgi:hypothetical protein